jgi:YD repeat-containing protein
LPPLTAAGRFRWFAFATGRSMVAGSLFSAAWGEMVKSPPEYARTLEGFGLRYRNSLAGVTMQNAIEASLGAAWGEDPRYLPYSTGLRDWKAKAAHSIKYTFLALRRDGRPMPAYSRYIGISVSNVISNQWRPPSETDAAGTLLRFAYGFAGRLTSNAVREFVPPVIRALRKKKPVDPVSATPPTASTVHVPPEH